MLVIRLARGGRNKYPTYRIVAAESARAATGKYVEVLGHYNPHTKELMVKKEETLKRLGNGAQPSNTVIKLLQREGIELPSWAKLKTKQPKPKTEEAKAEEAPAADEPTEEEVATEETATEELKEETPAEDEVRVAEAATENAADVEDEVAPAGKTETAEDAEAAAEKAEKVEAAGEKAALDAPDEPAEKADEA